MGDSGPTICQQLLWPPTKCWPKISKLYSSSLPTLLVCLPRNSRRGYLFRTRSSSLRVFSAAPVFFSSWPSSPSLLKSGVRKAELQANPRQAPPHAPHLYNPPPSIPDMTAKVNHGYLPDLPQQELREGQGRGYEHDLEPSQPARPRYGEELPYGRAGNSQGYAPSSQGGQATQFGNQFSWEPLPRVGGRGQQGRY